MRVALTDRLSGYPMHWILASWFACLLYGGMGLWAIGIVSLKDRMRDAPGDAGLAYNRRRRRQGYAALTGAGMAWTAFGLTWLIVRAS